MCSIAQMSGLLLHIHTWKVIFKTHHFSIHLIGSLLKEIAKSMIMAKCFLHTVHMRYALTLNERCKV